MTFNDFIKEWENESEMITVHTSGSTGSPKVIQLSKKFVKESAQRTIDFFKIKAGDNLHSCVAPDFIGGKMMAVRAIISKATLSFETPSNQPLNKFDKKKRINLLAVVPSQMLYILENISSLPNIKNIIIGGGMIHPDLKRRIVASGLNAYETYGMTETASHIALRKISGTDIPFTTLPGIKVKANKNNCLSIIYNDGISVETNDLAEIVSENEFYIKGRKDFIINSGGRKINPIEIENKILDSINTDFVIIGIPDVKWGQKSVLFIEGEGDSQLIELKVRKILPSWQNPKEYIYIKNLPRTQNGKIIRDCAFYLPYIGPFS